MVSIPTNRPVTASMSRTHLQDQGRQVRPPSWRTSPTRTSRASRCWSARVSVEISERSPALLAKGGIPHNVLNAKQHEREAEIIKDAGKQGAVTIATNMAGRGVDIKLGEGVADLGGLYVVGTERHERRRIDNQLRGRSGRQGDPGRRAFTCRPKTT